MKQRCCFNCVSFFFLFLFLTPYTIYAQGDPNNDPNWDWRAGTTFTVYPQLPYGAPVYTTSPFYQGGIGEAVFDNDPADGWRLVIRDFGTPSRGQAIPHFILYNKHQGLLRLFVFIKTPNTFSNGSVELYFGSTNKTAALTFLKPRAWATDKIDSVKDNRSAAVTPAADNYWSFSDFPMAYDPNTANVQNSRFHFKVWGLEYTTVNLGATGTLNQTFGTNQPANIPTPSPFSQGGTFDALGKNVQATYDSWNRWREMIGKAAAGIDQNSSSSAVQSLRSSLLSLKDTWLVSNLGAIGIGVGIVDFFLGGGRTNNQQRPAPMNFLLNFNLAGEMKTQHLVSPGVTLPVPGAIHTEQVVPVNLLYTQPLGIFNLTQTPILQERPYWQQISPSVWVQWKSYRLKDDLVWQINPSAEITPGNIEAAIVYRLPENSPWYVPQMYLGWADQGLITLESAHNGKYVFSTGYYPIEKMRRQIVANVPPGTDITVKIRATFNRQNAPAGTQPVVFVGTYQPTTELGSGGGQWFAGLVVPDDYATASEALNRLANGKTLDVTVGTHPMGSHTIPPNSSVWLRQGVVFNFSAGGLLTMSAGSKILGTSTNRPQLTSTSGSWQGITMNGGNGSVIQYINITYAKQPVVAYNTSNLNINNVIIGNSSFYNNNGSDAAAMRFYNSSPEITNVTINGQSNSWNGVRFAQGSTGAMTGGIVQNLGNGNGIVIQGNSSPVISGVTIKNNYYHGIVLNANGSGNPVIKDCIFESNGIVNGVRTYTGIRVYNGSFTRLARNTIKYSNYGIYVEYSSSIEAGEVAGANGFNLLTENNSGLVLYSNSSAYFGWYEEATQVFNNACNKLYNNINQNALANQNSFLLAQGAWWGTSPPNTSKIVAVNNSTIDYSNWRPYDDNDCYGVPLPRIMSSIKNGDGQENYEALLKDAFTSRLRKDYEASKSLYLRVLIESKDVDVRKRALTGVYSVFRETGDRSLISTVATNRDATQGVGVLANELLSMMHSSVGEYEETKRVTNALRAQYPDSEIEQRALFLLASLAGFDESQRVVSNKALAELQRKYGSSVDAGLLAAFGGVNEETSFSTHETESEEEQLLSSYPNPFNPSTQIRYSIKDAGYVSLKLYDLLGREVAVLVNEQKQPGAYSVEWNASSLPSGVYFSRLESGSRAIIQKLLLVR